MGILSKFFPGYVADGGSAPGDVCETLNQGLRRGNVMWAQTGARRRVEIFCIGDSLALQMGQLNDRSALWWAMALFNLAVTLKERGKRGVGTSTSGESGGNGAYYGMTSPGRMETDAAAIAQSAGEGYSPVVVMSIQTNDNYAGDNGQTGGIATVANVEKWFLYMLAFGLAHLVINGGGPSATGGANSIRTRGICNAYRALAEKYRGLITFVDNSEILAANTPAYTALGGKSVVGSTLSDELHPSAGGAYPMGRHSLGPALLALCGERVRLVGWVGDRYDATLNSRGPLMGDQTRYGGSAIAIPANTLSGTLTIAQDDVPDPIAAALGRPDIIARRLRFAGTPSAAGSLSVGRVRSNPAGYNSEVIPFMPEANVYCDITNIRAPNFGWATGGVGGQPNRNVNENPDADVLSRLKGLLTMYAGDTILEGKDYGNRSTSLTVTWPAGLEVAGDIIYISASDYAQPALPSASA